jgi:site-specific recombinase XerD
MKLVLKHVGECLYRAKASGIYYAVVKKGGKQFRKSLHTTSRKAAERKRNEVRSDVQNLQPLDGSFEDVAKLAIATTMSGKKPRSLKRRLDSLKAIIPSFEAKEITAIKPEAVDRFVAVRGSEISNRTFNLELETLNMVFRYAISRGVLLENPARHIQRRKLIRRHPEIPSKEQFARLIATIRGMNRRAWYAADLLELMAYSGMRLREATTLEWRHVDFQQRTLHITGGEDGPKNWKERTIPLFPALEKFLLELRERWMKQLKIRNLDDWAVIPIQSAKTALNSACEQANLPHYTHHHCRHFFCSNAIEAGVDFRTIAGWLGHSDGGVLVAQVYGHLRDEHSRAMAAKMTYTVAA